MTEDRVEPIEMSVSEALKNILDLSDRQRTKVEGNLKDILEKSRV